VWMNRADISTGAKISDLIEQGYRLELTFNGPQMEGGQTTLSYLDGPLTLNRFKERISEI
jgi:hypothetical protein